MPNPSALLLPFQTSSMSTAQLAAVSYLARYVVQVVHVRCRGGHRVDVPGAGVDTGVGLRPEVRRVVRLREESVHDLAWSCAAFLSAVRARTGQSVLG